MKIIVCIDKANGMMFNGRRQSQDKELRRKVMELCNGTALWMNAYSAKQFTDGEPIHVAADYLAQAKAGEYCFIEDGQLPPTEHIEAVYRFQWNRKYPSDVTFDLDLQGAGFKRAEKQEFVGTSHEKITLEMFER